MDVTVGKHPNNLALLPEPSRLQEMLQLSAVLAAPLDYVRVDLYEMPDGILFGELTLYPHGCVKEYAPHAFDEELRFPWRIDYGPCASAFSEQPNRPLSLSR